MRQININKNYKEIYKKIKGVLYDILAAFLVLCVGLSIYHIVNTSNLSEKVLDKDWEVTYKDVTEKKVDLKKYKLSKINKDEVVVLKRKIRKKDLKDTDIKDLSLKIEQAKVKIKVWIDKELIYENDNNKEVFLIHFKENYIGKKLKIELNATEMNAYSSIKCPSFVDEYDYVSKVIRNNFIDLFIAGFFMIYGVIALAISLCTRNKNMFMKRITLTGTFMLCLCMWLLSNNKAFSIFVDNKLYMVIMNYYSVYFGIPIFIILMYTFIFDEMYKKKYRILCQIVTILATITTIITICDESKLTVCKVTLEVLAFFSIVWCVYSNIKEIKKKKKSDKYLMISLAELSFIMLAEAIIYAVNFIRVKEYNTTIFIEIGLIVYIVMMVIAYLKYSEELLNNHIEKRELSNQAYQDMLTGLYNRIKVMEMLDKLEADEKKEYTIINFDLNDLKKTNDIHGHLAGDKYLKTFSDLIRNVFSEQFNVIGRVGGDEFIAISDDSIRDDTIEKSIKRVSKELEKNCKKNIGIEATFAYGYVSSSKKSPLKVDEAYLDADRKMYECKRKQKEQY